MRTSTRLARRALFGLVVAVLAVGSGASPTVADGQGHTTRYRAEFDEVTTPSGRVCPRGAPAPPDSFCFTGRGVGTSTPPGGRALEEYAGYVDFTQPRRCPDGTMGFADHNNVTITTSHGKIFLTTDGTACGLGQPTITDEGVWRIHGGTGNFRGATGSGQVRTTGAPNPNGTISSHSVYTGTITLH